MWGRISNFAEQIDANFSVDDVDTNEDSDDFPASSNNSGGGERGDDADDDDDEQEESGDLLEDCEDGWGDDDDVDFVDEDDMEFNDTISPPMPLMENEVVRSTAPTPTFQKASEVVYDHDAQNYNNTNVTENNDVSPILPSDDMVTVSAPGKALIAGGYLVLEPNNPGLVLAAEGCRFHTTVLFRQVYSADGGMNVDYTDDSEDDGRHSIPLDVYSPQFDRVFSYHLSYSLQNAIEENDSDACIRLSPRKAAVPQEPNKFVERSLLLAFGYLHQSMGAESFHARLQQHQQQCQLNGEESALAMKLRADNDFYSQITRLRERGYELTPQNLAKLEPFLPCPKDAETGEVIVNKTGMGSSAALVTSIVGALLTFFGAISLPTTSTKENGNELSLGSKVATGGGEKENYGLKITHNLAQICHCHAQGKVGSGFDVSAAVYGSHIYTRFSDTLIDGFLESVALSSKADGGGLQLSSKLSMQLAKLVNDVEWDCTMRPISLPPGLELLMADVCGGSESPSMARNILEWKKKKRKVGFLDDYYWKDLKRCNKKVISLLSEQFTAQTFLDGLRRDGAMIISTRTAEQWKKPMPSSWHLFDGSSWDVALKLVDLRMALLECRQNLKGMGVAAGVPVEPDVQSTIADATMKLPGVVAAGVPGAGGYDALFVIYVKGPETCDGQSDHVRDAIGNLWRDMSNESDDRVVCPLSVRAAGIGNGLYSTNLEW
ncbi:hypothetical protein ACHAWU_006358 [Discostella pseudostelligera]|uniref:phosphomevalonate kinase n=1 Tax=Discostella pseudostelligera TaxID=259834 RepID=A0ABD3N3X6_9STRA